MEEKYLIDTSIWIDMYEDRKGFRGEPLGDYASKFFVKIKAKGSRIILTDAIMRELEVNYPIENINGMFRSFAKQIDKIISTEEQRGEAKRIALDRGIPRGDVLHAIIARDNGLILITRDRHFRKVEDISAHYKPEEIT